jgi:hypothetical protein
MFYRVVTASRDTADLEATRTSLIVYNRSVELSQYNNLLLHLFSIPTTLTLTFLLQQKLKSSLITL